MLTNYVRIFFTMLLIAMLQACGGDSNKTVNIDKTKDIDKTTEKERQQSITKENYIDLAQYYFHRQSALVKVSTKENSLKDYKARSIPGKEARSSKETFTISALTPFNEHIEKMSIQQNSMKIEIEVVRKMYVSIKLYNNTSLVAEVQKTLNDFTNAGLTRPTGEAS